jgi:hypothetical protein
MVDTTNTRGSMPAPQPTAAGEPKIEVTAKMVKAARESLHSHGYNDILEISDYDIRDLIEAALSNRTS